MHGKIDEAASALARLRLRSPSDVDRDPLLRVGSTLTLSADHNGG
jgi:hypothetical protein